MGMNNRYGDVPSDIRYEPRFDTCECCDLRFT